MDPRYLPSDIILALRQVAMSGALTPEERAEVNAWLAGGAQPRSSRVTQGINNVLRNHNMPTLTGEPQPSQAQGAAPIAGPPQAPSPNAPLNTPTGPTPAQPRAPMLPVGTNTAPNAAPERAGNQTTPSLGSGFGVASDGPGAGGSAPAYTPLGGGQAGDGPGAGGSSPAYTPLAALATAITDGPGAGGGPPPAYASPGPAPAPAPAGGRSTTLTPPEGGTPQGRELVYRNSQSGQATFLDSLLQGMGIDLNHPGAFGGSIANDLKDVVPNIYSLIGLQGGVPGNVDTLYQDTLGKLINSARGGSLFSTLQGLGQGARQTVLGAGAAGIVDPGQQQNLLQAVTDLGSYGNNPWLRQGSANLLGNTFRDFNRVGLATQGGSNQPKDYIDWIRQQTDPQYRAVLRLLGVGQ